MSHFAVLVIGDNPDKQLAPYHEFECTGEVNEYVKSIDETEEALKKYDDPENTRTMLKTPYGLESPYQDKFYRDPTEEESKHVGMGSGFSGKHKFSWWSKDWGDGKGYRAKVRYIPEGCKEAEIPYKDIFTFLEFCNYEYEREHLAHDEYPDLHDKHKYGWIRLTKEGEVAELIARTNPNSKWDWYQIGGRYTGWFPLKNGSNGTLGEQGVFGTPAEPRTADQLKLRDVDFERAYNESEADANLVFDDWEALFKEHGRDAMPWSYFYDLYEKSDIDDLDVFRKQFNNQPLVKAYKESDRFKHWFYDSPISGVGFDRQAYIDKRRNQSLVPYAIVKNSVWYQKGEMGWWGMSSDEIDQSEWNKKFHDLLSGLDSDTLLTLVDCHI